MVVFFYIFFDRGFTSPYYGALMSEGTTSKRLPSSLDPRKQAHLSAIYDGVLYADDLARLATVVDSIDDLQARLSFYIGDQGERVVSIEVSGCVSVICQRCLQSMPLKVDIKSLVAIVRDEEDIKQLPSRYEPWLVEEQEANVYELIEEELLLNVPVVSYHDHDCIDLNLLQAGQEIDVSVEEESEGENPFKALMDLKDKLSKK